jgi:excisionase family DNA binding protein
MGKDELLTTFVVGVLLGVTARTIVNMINRGTIDAVDLNPNGKSSYRIPRGEVEKVLHRELNAEEIAKAKELAGKKGA